MLSSRRVLPLFIAAFLVLPLNACGGAGAGSDAKSDSDIAKAIDEATLALDTAQRSGRDLSSGPCIAESLPGLPDWVADIAHDPRESVDDEPANQCQRYRDGDAHHFVELAADGQLIRAE